MTQRSTSLDGLRGVAAFAVVISHIFYAYYTYLHIGVGATHSSTFEATLFHSPFSFFYRGNFSVAIFFVISGYVLSRSFFQNYSYKGLKNSALKRYFRLGIPVFASVMLSYLLIQMHLYPAREITINGWIGSLITQPASFIGALKEGVYSAIFFGERSYNYVLWTIQIELIGTFLLFTYLALFGANRYRLIIAVILCILMITGMRATGLYLSLFLIGALFNTSNKLNYQAILVPIGVLLALYLGGYQWRSSSYSSLADMAVWVQSNTWVVFHWPIFFPCAGACLLVYLVTQNKTLDQLLNLKIFQWLGKISYALYLIHPLVLSSVGLSTYLWLIKTNSYLFATMVSGITIIIISCSIAELFYRYVDKPATRWSARFSKWILNNNHSTNNKMTA